MPLYEISAMRSDGMNCGGTIEADNREDAMRECKRTLRKFTPQNGIACPIPGHKHPCYLHRGETFTFSNHSVTEKP